MILFIGQPQINRFVLSEFVKLKPNCYNKLKGVIIIKEIPQTFI